MILGEGLKREQRGPYLKKNQNARRPSEHPLLLLYVIYQNMVYIQYELG